MAASQARQLVFLHDMLELCGAYMFRVYCSAFFSSRFSAHLFKVRLELQMASVTVCGC